jgi:hypothetical protein
MPASGGVAILAGFLVVVDTAYGLLLVFIEAWAFVIRFFGRRFRLGYFGACI